jgi:hypothetical protein
LIGETGAAVVVWNGRREKAWLSAALFEDSG